MTRSHVALLRGINVGRAKRVAMADLRRIFESLGHTDVRTLLNSGNVAFTVRKTHRGDVAAQIEEAITSACGFSARVTVITKSELATAIAENPLGEVARDPSRFLVSFLRDPASRKLCLPLARQQWKPDAFAIGQRTAYLWCSDGVLASPLFKAFERALGDAATARNWATVIKLHALANGDASA